MEYRGGHNPQELEEFDEQLFRSSIDMGVDDIGIKAIYLGNYVKWHTKHQVDIIKKELGWKGQAVEGIPPQYDYEKIECRWQGERDYCKYIKRGHGRTNFLASIDIRNGELDRETALKLAEEYDGKRPASLDNFLEILGISEEEFEAILLENSIVDWGFNHDDLQDGKALPDMDLWDNTIS